MKRCSRQAATAQKGVRLLDFLRRPDEIFVLLMFGRVLSTFAQTETSSWLHRAAALQRYLTYDVPMDQQTLTATHNSFSSDSDPTTHSNFEVVTAQIYNITVQLSCLGVRGLELDLHYIEELAEEGDEDSAIRVCHTSAEAAEQVTQLCEAFGWDICEEAGVPNYGNDTGCRSDAPTLRESFEEIAAWVLDQDNINEVVYIKLDSSLDDQDELVSTIAADVFGESIIFSPDGWEASSSDGEDWPSPAELVDSGTRVILAGTEPSALVFSNINDTKEEIIDAEDFSWGDCKDSIIDGFPTPSWKRVQGDMVEYLLSRGNITIFSYIPEDDEALTASKAPLVMKCGLTPTFDRLDAELMEATIWSWDVDRPETGFASPRTAVASASSGRWTDTDSDSSAGEKHSFACRLADDRNQWKVVKAANATNSSNSSNSTSSASVSSSPSSSASNESTGIRGRRRRRRLGTSGSGYDGEESIYSDDLEGIFEGMFYEADEACDALENSYVFGAPRSAYENAVLIRAMEDAGVESAWVDYTSEGDSAGASICWTREDEKEYCVAASNNTCLSGSTGVEDIADGEVPMFQIAEWEVDNYTRPAYDALPLVEELHGWGRISGGNDFDLDDRFYVIGIILSAATVLVFGFIISCCCLPVGHIAAGSKQHHVDGTGFFGFLCPARCKQGDFLGSGTLAVVIFFTALTLMGGAATIYGVQSVDADIVNLWGNLDGMATVMVDAQTRMETILSRMENVEETITDVVACSRLSSLEGVGNGVSSAKAEVEELAVNGNIGSAGESIQSVNQEISRTSGMRRGVVYSAGGFVLVLSLLYVLVGFYALGKDDGNGKAGGARMRGPIMMGCLFLPLTLMVILLCWFLFGLSTSLALLTSDFCVSPAENTVSVFTNVDDQEVVGYYTTCEGSNVFSETLAVAYLQGMAASDLLSSVDADAFEATCPDKVNLRDELVTDLSIIVNETNNIGYLVRCSNINSYFVEGVEESLCSDAPRKTWFVVCGFAVVSMSLFVVAVSFRLLLQQKEEGLYRVVFAEDLTSDDGELGTLSSDSYPGDGRGNSGGNGAAVRAAINASSFEKNRRPRTVGIAVPVVATSAVLAENTFDDESGTGKPRLLTYKPSWSASAVSSAGARVEAGAGAGAGIDTRTATRKSATVASTPTRMAGVTVRAGRARPVEMAVPLPRSRSVDGGGDVENGDRRREKAGEVSINPFAATEGGDDPEAPSGDSSSASRRKPRRLTASVSDRGPITSQMIRKSSRSGRSAPHRTGRGDSGLLGVAIQKQQPPRGGNGVFSSSEDEKRRTNEEGWGGGHYDHGLRRSDSSRSRSAADVRHGAMTVPSKIFRSLAGLDDPYEEPPTVIVSRGCTPARTRGGGVEAPRGTPGAGGVSDSEKLIVTVARPSTVVADRLHRRGVEHGDGYASHSGVEEDKTVEYGEEVGASRASSSRLPSSNLARVGTSRSNRELRAKREPPARTRSSGQHILAAHPGTWAAFSRDHRKDSVVSATAGVNDFLSGSGGEDGTRRSRHEYHSSRRGRRRGDTSRGGAHSPESSSTASTPWRGHRGRQRMRGRLHAAGEGPGDRRGRHAIGDDERGAAASVTEKRGVDEEDLEEREEIRPTVELSLSTSDRGSEGGQGQAGGEETGEGEARSLSRHRAASTCPVIAPRDGVDVGKVTNPEAKRTRSRGSKATKIRHTAALSQSRSPKGRKEVPGSSSITPHVAPPSTSSGGDGGGDTRREQRREKRGARRTRSPHDGARSRKVTTK